jgi:spermidine synthase
VVKNAQNDVAIKINENYGLGSRLAFTSQIFQTRIPMLIFPQTERIFYLGMGTGITAGEALDRQSYPRVSKVMACEISASVIAASRKYFGGGDGSDDLTNGLYKDPRAKVIHEDGRNHLMATAENYQMINADLFLPYRRGTGNLYSKEHFANAKKRLSQGGVFVQWLPLYQVSENEFGTIARTMLEVFPQVTLWRGNFIPGAETAAIIGHADSSPIPPCLLDTLADQRKAVAGATHREMNQLMLPTNEQTILFFYCGNLTKARDFFEKYPVNTYDHPVIEFATPRSLHQAKGQKKPQFLEDRFAGLVDRLLERTPPVADPVLALRSSANHKLPMAGAAFHQAAIASVHGKEEDAARYWQSFLDGWQDDPFAGQGDQ